MIDLFDDDCRKSIATFIKNESERLVYNSEIQQILDGDLLALLDAKMKLDLGTKSYMAASTRKAPINIYRKIVDKLTKIYDQPVIRTVIDGTDKDKALVSWYETKLSLNTKMDRNNFKFNAFYYALLQIGLKDPKPNIRTREPFVRTIPNHEFLIMNASESDPSSSDVIILCMPSRTVQKKEGYKVTDAEQEIYYVWSDYQFIIIDEAGDIQQDLMFRYEQDGVNPYETTPFAYSNASDDKPMPAVQTDNKDMALLIPLLLTDLNYAVKYQAFSLFVAINIDEKKVELSPNSILSFQTPPGDDRQPSFQSIKPTIDISETLNLASSQMSLWLSTKGIRAGSISQLTPDTFSSGISKMIDESDTYESLKKQIQIYMKTEAEFWEKLLKHIHPKWVSSNMIDQRELFSVDAYVVTKFHTPVPMQTRGEKISELKAERDAGLTTRRRSIEALNPDMTDEDIDLLIQEILDEASANARPIPRTAEVIEE